MKIYNEKEHLISDVKTLKNKELTIGFVPTMGALHQGHLSLIQKATEENNQVIVSIFVNPTQFNNQEDLEKYPRTIENDLELIKKVNPNAMVYTPSVSDIYGDDVTSQSFSFDGLDTVMEGAMRPGHFDGVGTIVKKLFQITTPTRAYFGEKDYQQLLIIKKMVALENLPVEVIGCPIIREESGLAMSSRNQRLSSEMKEKSAFIYQTLLSAKEMFQKSDIPEVKLFVEGAFSSDKNFELEYFTIANANTLQISENKEEGKEYRAFVAVFVEGVRLIDNIAL